MSLDQYPARTSHPELRTIEVLLLGTGAAAPTVTYGKGVTATRTGAGVYKLSFSDDPGTLVGVQWGLVAATPGDVKTHSVVLDTHVAKSGSTNAYVEVSFFNASGTAHDLAASEWISLTLKYTKSSLT